MSYAFTLLCQEWRNKDVQSINHQKETFSALLCLCVGNPLVVSFIQDSFIVVSLNKLLNKHSIDR